MFYQSNGPSSCVGVFPIVVIDIGIYYIDIYYIDIGIVFFPLDIVVSMFT